jgi:hypothetical protein
LPVAHNSIHIQRVSGLFVVPLTRGKFRHALRPSLLKVIALGFYRAKEGRFYVGRLGAIR